MRGFSVVALINKYKATLSLTLFLSIFFKVNIRTFRFLFTEIPRNSDVAEGSWKFIKLNIASKDYF
ncbi:hypothetical protein CWB66_01595 [Pseudoalteromonas sp. S558]|nr:hypothetical protein CWB66_01595 [Pseudoalteromonas sp. S558]